MDDFEIMDQEAGDVAKDKSILLPPEYGTSLDGSAVAFRDSLVKKHHKGAGSLVERLRGDSSEDADSLLVALLDEIIGESDNLLGNHLVAAENGELRDASIISFKRAEVLEKAIKAVQSKQQFEKENGLDLDSPAMIVIFRFFMQKANMAFKRLEMPEEQSDVFFQSLGELMEDWKKELRHELETMKAR